MLWHLNLASSQIQSNGHHLFCLPNGNNGPHNTKMKVFILIGSACFLIFGSCNHLTCSDNESTCESKKRLPLQELQTRPGIQGNDRASLGATTVLKNLENVNTSMQQTDQAHCSTSTQFEDRGMNNCF